MTQTPFRSIFIDRGFFISICIFVAILPVRPAFLHNVQAYALILLLIFALFKVFLNKDFNLKEQKWELLLFCSLYIFWGASLLYSDNLSQGFKYLETKLGLVLIPFFLIGTNRDNKLKVNQIILIYALSVSFFMLLSYLSVIYQNYQYNQFDHVVWVFFIYHSLVRFIGMHATYMSIQVAFAFLIVLNLFMNSKSGYKQKLLYIFWLSFLLLSIVCLTVKMVILAFLVSVIGFLLIKIPFKTAVVTISAIVIVLFILINAFSKQTWFNERTQFIPENLNKEYTDSPENEDGSWGSINLRIALAKNALEIFKDNPVIGVGIGDGKETRLKTYKKNSFYYALNEEFNEHNQYLNILVTIGILGLIIFFLILAIPAWQSINSNDALYLGFIILICISFLGENYLSRLHGVSFFAVFHTLLWLRNKTILSK